MSFFTKNKFFELFILFLHLMSNITKNYDLMNIFKFMIHFNMLHIYICYPYRYMGKIAGMRWEDYN